jgi:Tol biopolymer transport system component
VPPPPPGSGSGGRIGFTSTRDGNYEIYAINVDGSNLVRLTNNPAQDSHPGWSPDGQHIVFQSNRTGPLNLYIMDADGSNVRPLDTNLPNSFEPAWSPDGSQIAFAAYDGTFYGLFVVDWRGGTPREVFTDTPTQTLGCYNVNDPAWSPDSQHIAFWVGGCGAYIFVADVNGHTPPHALTSFPGCQNSLEPAWSPDGSQIAFSSNRTTPTACSDAGNIYRMYSMSADGSNVTNLLGSTNRVF